MTGRVIHLLQGQVMMQRVMTNQAIHRLPDQMMTLEAVTSRATHLHPEVKAIEATAGRVIVHHHRLQTEVVVDLQEAVAILPVDLQVVAIQVALHEDEDKFQ